jgi:hypothetical protein
MTLAIATMITCLLLVSQCCAADLAPKHSKIEKLIEEVNGAKDEAGEHRNIVFVTKAATYLEGNVDYESEIIVTVPPPSGSQDYDDAIKAHELFHIILNSRGFAGIGFSSPASAADLFPPSMRLDVMRNGGLLNQVAGSLNSCFSDELIDRETAKRGFKSQLLPQKEMNGKIQLAERMSGTFETYPDLVKRGQALQDFCLLNRLSETEKLKYESATESMMGPSEDGYRKTLLQNFKGKRCEFGDPDGCHQLTLQLRQGSGFSNVIHLRKPKTGEME